MKHLNNIIFLTIIFNIAFIGCSSRSVITDPNTSIISSLDEITKNNNNKAQIAKILPKKIGNMELFKVADYTKRIIIGPDLGYGISYDLKNNRKGSGVIFLYKRYKKHVEDGLSNDALTELKAERRTIEKTDTNNAAFSKVNIRNIQFYKMKFFTPPDVNNEQYDCYLFITGYNGVYLKVLFYYPANSKFGEEETGFFMNSLVMALNNHPVK